MSSTSLKDIVKDKEKFYEYDLLREKGPTASGLNFVYRKIIPELDHAKISST